MKAVMAEALEEFAFEDFRTAGGMGSFGETGEGEDINSVESLVGIERIVIYKSNK